MRTLQFLTFTICVGILSLSVNSRAAVFEVESFDYGTPGDQYDNPIAPGESGDMFFTLVNKTAIGISDLQLEPRSGSCIESIHGNLASDFVQGNSTTRFGPVQVTLRSDCVQGQPANMLFVGTYRDNIQQINRTWVNIDFAVQPLPEIHFADDAINLPINDNSSVHYNFTINQNLPIQDSTVTLTVRHSYIGDLRIILTHMPSATEVVLHNLSGGSSNDINETWGRGGTPLSALSALNGLDAQGDWKLSVYDEASGDTGSLRSLRLSLYGN